MCEWYAVYQQIDLVFRFVTAYISIASVVYYFRRKYWSGDKDYTMFMAFLWLPFLPVFVLYLPFFAFRKIAWFIDESLDKNGKPDQRDRFQKAACVKTGDILMTEDGLDFGIVTAVRADGKPAQIGARLGKYDSKMPHYGGIEYADWYETGICMSESEWVRLSLEREPTEWYAYFRDRVGLPAWK